jgi:hypothetical protein
MGSRRIVVARAIAPVAAVARPARILNWPWPIPGIRGTIPATPSHEDGAVVVDVSAWTPTPTPATPTPGIIGGYQPSDSDSDSERDKRRGRSNGGAHVHHRGVVHRHIHHLRIRRLNHIDSRPPCLLDLHLLLLRALQVSGVIGLAPQPLDGRGNRPRISCKCLANRGVVVNIVGHHRNHPGEIAQGQKCRIEALLLRRVSQCLAGQAGVRGKPVAEVQNLLRIYRGGRNLRQQRVRIQSNRRQQLVQLLWRRHWRCGLCLEGRRKERKKKKTHQKPNGYLTRSLPHRDLPLGQTRLRPHYTNQRQHRSSLKSSVLHPGMLLTPTKPESPRPPGTSIFHPGISAADFARTMGT